MTTLRPWPLLLAGEEGVEGDVGDLDNLEPDSGDVTDSVALPAETGDQHFVVLLDKVETTVLGHEGGDLLGVLDQLDTDTLPDGGVGLLSLDTDLKQTNECKSLKKIVETSVSRSGSCEGFITQTFSQTNL